MNLKTLFTSYRDRLQALYPKQEAESLVFWLFEHFLGAKRMDVLKDIPVSIPDNLPPALEKLMSGQPIQYVLGKSPFYGREFKVSPAVLIPRNETEELVHLIIQENTESGLRILDIGTGTGCIPITLALELKGAEVFGLDISTEALDIARQNAGMLNAKVSFFNSDILDSEIPVKEIDVLVSNPPYVKEEEKNQMHQNVLDHEPHLALFVKNDDPLLFYRAILDKSGSVLKKGGKLYFEINEAHGKQVKELMEDKGFRAVRILKDLNEKDRIVVGTHSGS